jgi:hypothetical protein
MEKRRVPFRRRLVEVHGATAMGQTEAGEKLFRWQAAPL